MDEATFEALCDAIRENARESLAFEQAARTMFKSDAADLEEAITAVKTADKTRLLNLFSLGGLFQMAFAPCSKEAVER